MDDTQKMLQAIIHGQGALRQELSSRIDKLDEKLSEKINNLDRKIDKVDKKLTKRLDSVRFTSPGGGV